jgi:predicted transcriptional regulator
VAICDSLGKKRFIGRIGKMVNQEYMNLKETAVYVGRSYRAIKKHYRSWEMFGIIPSRRPGEREVFFKRSDLDLLHEKTKIILPNERAGRKCAVL